MRVCGRVWSEFVLFSRHSHHSRSFADSAVSFRTMAAATAGKRPKYKKFKGSALFRHRIVLATLTHTPIEIHSIRESSAGDEGLKDFEMSFLTLMDSITNGSLFEINESGTRVRYRPGTIVGLKKPLIHKCPTWLALIACAMHAHEKIQFFSDLSK